MLKYKIKRRIYLKIYFVIFENFHESLQIAWRVSCMCVSLHLARCHTDKPSQIEFFLLIMGLRLSRQLRKEVREEFCHRFHSKCNPFRIPFHFVALCVPRKFYLLKCCSHFCSVG